MHLLGMCLLLRLLQDGDPEGWWEETFNGHTDSKPSGPEAVSMDITFPGYKHVYGLPERATNFSLQPTAGGAQLDLAVHS
jgi:alpha 1,3-glucosidase